MVAVSKVKGMREKVGWKASLILQNFYESVTITATKIEKVYFLKENTKLREHSNVLKNDFSINQAIQLFFHSLLIKK